MIKCLAIDCNRMISTEPLIARHPRALKYRLCVGCKKTSKQLYWKCARCPTRLSSRQWRELCPKCLMNKTITKHSIKYYEKKPWSIMNNKKRILIMQFARERGSKPFNTYDIMELLDASRTATRFHIKKLVNHNKLIQYESWNENPPHKVISYLYNDKELLKVIDRKDSTQAL